MRVAMLAEFNHDPPATHLVGDRAGSTGTGERVQHQITREVESSSTRFINASGFFPFGNSTPAFVVKIVG